MVTNSNLTLCLLINANLKYEVGWWLPKVKEDCAILSKQTKQSVVGWWLPSGGMVVTISNLTLCLLINGQSERRMMVTKGKYDFEKNIKTLSEIFLLLRYFFENQLIKILKIHYTKFRKTKPIFLSTQ